MPVPSGTISLSTGNWSDLVQNAYDTVTGLYLRDFPTFRAFVDKEPVAQAMPSDVVTLTIRGKLATNKTPLTENLDVDAVALPANRQLNVTLLEYGNAIVHSKFLEKTAFTGKVMKDVGFDIATNMNDSMDEVYRDVLDTATNVLWVHDTTGPQLADPTTDRGPLTSVAVATAVARLRARLAVPRDGTNHFALVHPDVSHDIRSEVGSTAWIEPHKYVDTREIYNGETGTFRGARFVEHTRCTKVAGGANPDAYNTYFLGREALVEAVAEEPHVVVGPNIDKLNRFRTIGWYALLGVSIYRQNAIEIVKSASSLEISGLSSTGADPKA